MNGTIIFTEENNNKDSPTKKTNRLNDRRSFLRQFPKKYKAAKPHYRDKDTEWQKSLKEKKKLDSLVKRSQTPLYSIRSVFPFDFFPDQISIEPKQINIVVRNFFYSENVQSIPFENVVDCILETSFFFATLKVVDITFGPNVFKVEYLKKSEAQKARRIIQGLIIATKEDLDLSRMNSKELSEKVEMLGSA